jgi:hypothetical protein
MSEAPPAYHEIPYEDHAAQLEQMKAMMEQMRLEKEQMRLDKERLETEAKRYEMEVKRKEDEEAAALRIEQEREKAAKEKKEIDAVFSLFRDAKHLYYPAENAIDYLWKNAGEEESKFLRSLEASGETILLAHLDMNTLRCDYSGGSPHKRGLLKFVLTNCHVYQCTYTAFVKTNSTSTCGVCPITRTETPNAHRENCNSLKTGTFYASTLYSFTNPLNLVHAKILSSIMTIPMMNGDSPHPTQSLWNRVIGALVSRNDAMRCNLSLSDALKKFESIIRLIPGSYKNGSWRQLDGFFGMYFNETTMEVSEVPPPL